MCLNNYAGPDAFAHSSSYSCPPSSSSPSSFLPALDWPDGPAGRLLAVPEAVGHSDVASVTAMLACLPSPYAGAGGKGGGKGGGDEDIGSLVLMPPTIKRELKWLVVTAHCGEYLPVLDDAVSAGGITLSSSGLDAYYKVS